MKLITTADLHQANDFAANTAVLLFWDFRDLNRFGVSVSDIYVNDGEGGWAKSGQYVVEKLAAGKWQARQVNAAGESVHMVGNFKTRKLAKDMSIADLRDRLGAEGTN